MRFLGLLALCAAVGEALGEYVAGRAFDRFMTIWLENQDFNKTDQNADMQALIKQGILLTSYYGLTHPSQPNYIASVGGDYFGLDDDGFVQIPRNVTTLVDLFDSRGIEWRGYFEGVPGPGYMGEASGEYVRKHNPFISYDSVSTNGTRLVNLQSLDDFNHDLDAGTLPQYMHLSPNILNDGHNTGLAYGANWTKSFLTPLLKNDSFMNRTLILLTYDESETYSVPNKIVSLLLGGAVPASKQGTTDDTVYTHYSILSTLENNWELACLGRYDVGANVFDLVASQTNYSNRPPSNIASINNSLSYPGFLNNDPTKYLPVPVPNLQLIGAGGKGVDDMTKALWSKSASSDTPYDGSGMLHDGGDGGTDPNAPVYKAQAPVEMNNGKSSTSTAVATATSTGSAASTTASNGAGTILRVRDLKFVLWVGFAGIGVGML